MMPQQRAEEPTLETLEDLDDVLCELMLLGLIQAWPSRESRYRATGREVEA